MRKLCNYLVIILLANISFLFSPREFPAEAIHKWGDFYIPLNSGIGVRVNGDAFAFVALATNPGRLLEKNQVRQSRPGYIIAANLVGSVIYAVTYPFRDQLEHFFQSRISDNYPQKEKEKIARWFSYYSAFVFLNLLVLLACLYIFDKLVLHYTGPWKNKGLHFLFLFLLVANPVTKLFFWSPHVQMFNILLPLLMVWTCIKLYGFSGNNQRFYIVSAFAGILLLFYGSFLLLLPILLFSYWKNLQLTNRSMEWENLLTITLILLFYALPVLLWMGYIQLQGIPFYSAEIAEYRQFIWIADALRASRGNLFSALLSNTIQFINSLASLMLPAFFLLAAFLYSRKQPANTAFPASAKQQILPTLLFCLLFFWLLGYYADRLSFSLAGILYLTAALYINSIPTSRRFTVLFWAICLIAHFALIIGNPGYFGPTYFN